MDVLVTGAEGFVGRNLVVALASVPDVRTLAVDVGSPPRLLADGLRAADIVFHLAGVNRPPVVEDFHRVNASLTEELSLRLMGLGRSPAFVLASSIQAALDNPYGRSKLAAEQVLKRYSEKTGARVVVHRLKNVFGKWGRPNYNSVTATFCHNIAHGLPIEISDPATELELTYIDDVVEAFLGELAPEDGTGPAFRLADPLPSYRATLGGLAALIQFFRDHRATLTLPDFSDPFTRALYATYLSYLEQGDLSYVLPIRSDDRGSLAEFLKAPAFGQVFVSRTRPGVTRGNHHHQTKTEKFLVVEGNGLVRLRHVGGGAVVQFRVSGGEFRVVDIPPGYTHSIENVGAGELVTVFWACEVFDPSRPDTHPLAVLTETDPS